MRSESCLIARVETYCRAQISACVIQNYVGDHPCLIHSLLGCEKKAPVIPLCPCSDVSIHVSNAGRIGFFHLGWSAPLFCHAAAKCPSTRFRLKSKALNALFVPLTMQNDKIVLSWPHDIAGVLTDGFKALNLRRRRPAIVGGICFGTQKCIGLKIISRITCFIKKYNSSGMYLRIYAYVM